MAMKIYRINRWYQIPNLNEAEIRIPRNTVRQAENGSSNKSIQN